MKYLIFACCILLMSCYSPIPLTLYEDSYRDRQVEEEENEFVVVTKGNTRTSMDRVSDYAILRTAQLMEEEGFKYFVVSKEIKDFASTKILWGNVAMDVENSRNPVMGLLVTGYNEKPKLEDKSKKQKIYKTADVLEELNHYINEARSKEYDSAKNSQNFTVIL